MLQPNFNWCSASRSCFAAITKGALAAHETVLVQKTVRGARVAPCTRGKLGTPRQLCQQGGWNGMGMAEWEDDDRCVGRGTQCGQIVLDADMPSLFPQVCSKWAGAGPWRSVGDPEAYGGVMGNHFPFPSQASWYAPLTIAYSAAHFDMAAYYGMKKTGFLSLDVCCFTQKS